MKISAIYKIQSKIKPENIYIGSSLNINKRWRAHLEHLRKNKHHSQILQNHFNKYGEYDLVFIIIEPCLPMFLTVREQYYINSLHVYFNVCKTAGSPLGIKHSKEFKEKISKLKKGIKFTNEHRKKISDSLKGKIHTYEHNKKISEWHTGRKQSVDQITKRVLKNTGKKRSEETKYKQSIAALGKPKSEEAKNNMKLGREGMRLSEEHKKNIGLAGTGKIHSEITKTKMIEAWRLRKLKLINQN